MKFFKSIGQYIINSIHELKKVTWPTKKQVLTYTLVVVVMSLAVAVYFGVLDYGFNWLFELIITK
ncbi:MAG: preprotein translocase subunit SecE [Candidatus Magasanikbacteria bacterium]